MTTRCPEAVAGQHVTHGSFRFFQGHGHDDALARRQTVSLDDDGCAAFAHVGQGLVHIREVAVGGRGDIVTGQKVLGEGLGAFQAGTGRGGAEGFQAGLAEAIHHTGNQRGFRTHDGQLNGIFPGKTHQSVQIHHVDGDIFHARLRGRAGIAWSHVDLFHVRGLGGFPGQGMFPAAAANDKYFHLSAP